MITPRILPLADALDIALAGGKAVNLAKMIRAGLPVPDGFVITTAAFNDCKGGAVSGELAENIRQATASLNADLMAVRSSATAEDMAGASMAGQYETYLNLQTADGVVDAVGKCWRSMQSDRSIAYLKQHGIDPDNVAMAVVVQKLVAADVSGVLFTVDPRTGSREHMLIEATWGLGECLVSGEVQPDVVRVCTTGNRVESYEIASKKQTRYAGDGNLVPVPPEKQDQASLTYDQIMQLREMGRRAEEHLGAMQDIEWAIEAGTLHLLQSRPVTTIAETDAFNDLLRDIKARLTALRKAGHGPWVRHNLGETLVHPTPFTWSIIAQFMSGGGGFGKMYKELGFEPGPAVSSRSFLECIGGEVYMDCSLMPEMIGENYPFAYSVEALRNDPDAAQAPPTVPNGTAGQLYNAGKLARTATEKIHAISVDLDKRFDEDFVPKLVNWTKSQKNITLADLDDDGLICLWTSQVEKVLGEFGVMAFLPSMVEAVATAELRSLVEELSWDEEPSEVMSQLSASGQLDQTLAANADLSRVAAGEMELGTWLEQHGHRAPAEFELATPRWSERPDDIKQMAAQMTGDADFHILHLQRQQAATACLQRLQVGQSTSTCEKLRAATALVQRYCRFREDGKYHLMRAYSVLRCTALEFGRRLGIGDDIFFLLQDEAIEALRTGFVPKGIIADRRLTWKVETRLSMPHVIDTDDIENLGASAVHTDGQILAAHSIAGGVAAGPAVVVLSPESAGQLPHHAILVCRSTDPSWTPLFVNAAGLVLERGGSLSHGAVVAREMGLPAVVLEGATQIIQSNEWITVDANAGRILRDNSKADAEQGNDTHVPRKLVPPPPGTWDQKINRHALAASVFWGIFMAAFYLLPDSTLHDPVMALIDVILWPLVPTMGMIGAVAVVAILMGFLPILAQRFITDNRRLSEAKRRSNLLLAEANSLPAGSPRIKVLDKLASPVTWRVLKASMVPLGFILGPMILVFLWFPIRVDPASWNAEPGHMISVTAEIDGDYTGPVALHVPMPLELDPLTPEQQTLPPIRQELEEIRDELRRGSDMSALPWEVQSAGEHTRQTMLASLHAYLNQGVPVQKLTWLINVPDTAAGAHTLTISAENKVAARLKAVFSDAAPPAPEQITPAGNSAVKSVTIHYPRQLRKVKFWAPLARLNGPAWDFGWLGVYLLAYLPTMLLSKRLLKVP